MRILADENIPFAREAFGPLGEVVTYKGRALTREQAAEADVLLVRSVTQVNADLLDGSRVRFVGTATIGEDHIDKPYLAERGIGFAGAPGSNADSVAQYMASALLCLAEKSLPAASLRGLALGIIGVGNVGSRVAEKARALGMDVILNDPPLARETGDAKYRPLDEVFAADLITTHVPLAKDGPDPTYHLANASFFARMRDGAVYLNTSRGAVADTQALLDALDTGRLAATVLDVWEPEPDIPAALLERAFLGTPHIAGYSFDGKVNGTRMVFEAACAHLGIDAAWDPAGLMPAPDQPVIDLGDATGEDALRVAVRASCDVREDDARLRLLLQKREPQRGAYFDQLRKTYAIRREFPAFAVTGGAPEDRTTLAALGFRTA